jgi:hypothetical protein
VKSLLDEVMLVIDTGPAELFVKERLSGPVVRPGTVLLNFKDAGDIVVGLTPLPDRFRICALFTELLIVMLPDRAPVPAGAKVTEMEQVAATASEVPQVLF